MQRLKEMLNGRLPAAYREVQRFVRERGVAAVRRGALAELAATLGSGLTPGRRRALQALAGGVLVVTAGRLLWRDRGDRNGLILSADHHEADAPLMEESDVPAAAETEAATMLDEQLAVQDENVRDYLYKMRNFNASHDSDIFLTADERALLGRVVKRLRRARDVIGHANFSLLSFDSLLYYARNYSRIGAFRKDELALMERVFYTDARELGFFGDKVLDQLTVEIRKRDTLKVAGSGNYLYRGKPEALFRKISREGGSEVILSSGVRGVVKQMHLFMEKAVASDGNLSLASRSLAPPGYSFHGISDFDVGQRNLGYQNFTSAFAECDVYRRLSELGYLTMRYPLDNMLGVRYEPWHVKVT